MADTPAQYSIVSWVQRGLSAFVTGQPATNYATLPVSLTVNGTAVNGPSIRLLGPGDITGLDARGIIRTDPRDGAEGFEPNYLAIAELALPDLPWMFTPSGVVNGRLQPWICLIVVPDRPGAVLQTRSGGLSVLRLENPLDPKSELPDLSNIDSWVHAQVTGAALSGDALNSAFATNPAGTLSRLISPRRLQPDQRYIACIVPTYRAGANAALGLPVDDHDVAPAWDGSVTAPFTLPVYYYFRFATGPGGDFASLAQKIVPAPPHTDAGTRLMDASEPGFGVAPLPRVTLGLEGALRTVDSPPPSWPAGAQAVYETALRRALSPPAASDPVVAPPTYGSAQARVSLPAPNAPPVWLRELNLDPRTRVAASTGAQVVQKNQEALVASAWEQLGQMREANRLRQQAQLARAVSASLANRHLQAVSSDGDFLQITAPMHSRVVLTGGSATLRGSIDASSLPSGAVSAGMRKLARPRGPVGRQVGPAAHQIVQRLNQPAGTPGALQVAGAVQPPRGMIALDAVVPPAPGTPSTVDVGKMAGGNLNGAVGWMPAGAATSSAQKAPAAVISTPAATPNAAPLVDWSSDVNLPAILKGARAGLPAPLVFPSTTTELAAMQQEFRTAAAAAGATLQVAPATDPAPPPLGGTGPAALSTTRTQLQSRIDPERTIQARMGARIPLGTGPDPLQPVSTGPQFNGTPMYTALAALSPEWMLPSSAAIPVDSATVLAPNPPFIEAFMTGLNEELSHELLWRQYPADPRSTYFQNFWGASTLDMPEIRAFDPNLHLGEHLTDRGSGNSLVLLIRAGLFRRYPNAVVTAVQAAWSGGVRTLTGTRQYPLFRGQIGADITFFGFTNRRSARSPGPCRQPPRLVLRDRGTSHGTALRTGTESGGGPGRHARLERSKLAGSDRGSLSRSEIGSAKLSPAGERHLGRERRIDGVHSDAKAGAGCAACAGPAGTGRRRATIMSSTGTQPPVTFVRGTTDPQVYIVSAGTRRLVPDSETLAYLLAGQAVRTLSDADLAALPLGTPLPTRKNGALLTQKFAAPPPAIVVYYMANGLRRRIVDLATQLGLVQAGSQILTVELSDLSAISEGAPLPTRSEGTLYQGTGKTFAYAIQGGKKLAFPDATTLRDSGRDSNARLPITAEDLGFIPDGPAFPTTSRFLSPPAAEVPLVLLPVRLETRIQNNVLWLRIYPDDIHINSFEPNLTADEQAARTEYLALAQVPVETRRAAFGALARQFGPARAAWVAGAGASSVTKSADWTMAPFTNVLPERWIVIGYQGNAAGQVLAVGPQIQDSLPVGPAPNASGPLSDDATRWITDFDRAVQAGMGFRIPLSGVQQRGFTRLVVLGLRTSLDPAASAARLEDLLQAHHYTDGFELLPHNTPTNNTDDVAAGGASKDPDHAQWFALEQGPPLCPSRLTADGDRLARALGIRPDTLAHVRGADGAQDEQVRALNTVLWPGTLGYYLTQIVNGAVPDPGTMVPAVREHFADHVRARGHFPAVRVGRQPYGILPVLWSAGWKSLEGRPLDAPLNGLLAQLRTIWSGSIANGPRIPNAADPEAALVSLLGMTPSSTSFIARALIGPEYNFAYWNFVKADLKQSWWTALANKVRLDGSNLASALANTRLASATYVSSHRPLSDLLVAPAPLDGLPAPDFVAQLAGKGWEALRDAQPPAAPVPMLFLLLRHAALRQYLDTALDLLVAANAAQASERIEAELVGFTGIALRPTAWDLLQRVLPGRGPVGALLDQAKTDSAQPAFAAFWSAFTRLAQFSAADLDAAAREALDLSSYRLDSWITSLAHVRLDQLRSATPGIVLGAYGWLENVGSQPQPASQGYVHAPSLNQSTTAAVLRSGYLTHLGGSQQPFAIDLSSARVRLALHLLDGIREGQSLGALLGYRLERTLHETGLDTLVDRLRGLFPTPGGAQFDVVDGLAVARQFHSDPQTFWTSVGFTPTSVPQGTGLNAAVSLLYAVLDSVADLALAESVHHLTQGNLLRAGATLDSIARGDTPPPEIEFAKTPRSGTALTYRILAVAAGDSAPEWTVTPRAQAEPRLNAWAASLLGDPSRVRIRVRFASGGGASLSDLEMGLNQLGLAPVDLLSFPDSPGIAGELAARIQRAASQLRLSSVPADASVEILSERNATWTPQTIGLTEFLALVQALARLAAGSRPLEPADLVVQGDTPGAIDTAELQSRADRAESQLRGALAALQASSAGDAVLMGAAAFGVAGSIPAADPSSWPDQVAAAAAELAGRVQALDRVAAGFVRATASPVVARDHDVARIQAVFGPSFVVLPALAPDTAEGWPQLWTNSLFLQQGDATASIRWMQRMSRVRPGVTRMDTALLFAEALAGRSLLQLQVAQLPRVSNDRWVALEAPGTTPSSRLSLVAFAPTPVAAGAQLAGLLVDEWIDVWPSADQVTGVSFQYSDPIARAPQAILLAVRPDDFPEWTLESVEGSVLEALQLAKLRTVDPDVLLGTVPPLQVDSNVKAFQALSETEAFVLDAAGNLWLEHGPFGAPPPAREQVDRNVSAFQALSESTVLVLSNDGNLWLEHAPFGTVPPARQQVDANVALSPPVPRPTTTTTTTTTTPRPTTAKVPNLFEMSPAEAQQRLQGLGLVAKFSGPNQARSWVSSQSPAAGTVVPIGSTVSMVLSNLAPP